MRKSCITLLIILFLFFCNSLKSQNSSFVKYYDFPGWDAGQFFDIEKMNDGSYITSLQKNIYYDIHASLLKIDSLGNRLWEREIGDYYNYITSMGQSVCIDSNNNIYWAGYGSIEYLNELIQIPFLAKFSPDGELLWHKHINIELYSSEEPYLYQGWFHDIDIQNNESIIAVGSIFYCQPSSSSRYNGYIVSFDLDGNVNWEWHDCVDSENNSMLCAVSCANDGTIYTIGECNTSTHWAGGGWQTRNSGLIGKLSPTGELLSRKKWKFNETASLFRDCSLTMNNQLAIVGAVNDTLPGSTDYKQALIIVDDNLTPLYQFNSNLGTAGSNQKICCKDSLIYVFSEADPNYFTDFQTDYEEDKVIKKFDLYGNMDTIYFIGGTSISVYGKGDIIINDDNSITFGFSHLQYAILVKTDSLQNIPDFISDNVYPSDYEYIIYNSTPNYLRDDNCISVYPNPANQSFNITLLSDFLFNEVIIYNMNGQIVKTHTDINPTVDISSLQNGIYFIKLIGNERTIVKKLIVQH